MRTANVQSVHVCQEWSPLRAVLQPSRLLAAVETVPMHEGCIEYTSAQRAAITLNAPDCGRPATRGMPPQRRMQVFVYDA